MPDKVTGFLCPLSVQTVVGLAAMNNTRELADSLIQVLDSIQTSVREGKSKLEPRLAGELDTAVRSLCAAVKSNDLDSGTNLVPEPLT
jgi:hypothetical protein